MKQCTYNLNYPKTASLLAQERGLKHSPSLLIGHRQLSLLAQERGLKPAALAAALLSSVSLLAQERGLKHFIIRSGCSLIAVAPRAGAWIETGGKRWGGIPVESLLAQERGLKRSGAV